MTQHNVAATVSDTAAAKGIVMPFLESLTSVFNRENRLLDAKNLFFYLLILCGLFTNVAKAQYNDTLNIHDLGFQINAPNVILNQGETATLEIVLGSSAVPINDAIGFDIELELGENAVFPTQPEFLLDGSWFFPSASGDTIQHANASNGTIGLQGSQTSGQTGHGRVFRIVLEASEDGVQAADLIAAAGGIVLVEDLGFKRAPILSDQSKELVLYPNPASDRLWIDFSEELPLALSLYDQQGKEVLSRQVAQLYEYGLSVGQLPRGTYLLVVRYLDRQDTRRIILK
jgi:hypothetical protein